MLPCSVHLREGQGWVGNTSALVGMELQLQGPASETPAVKQKYRALLALRVCGVEVTPSPGSHHIALHFSFRDGANSAWAVPEGEGAGGWDTVCAVGLSFPCHTHVDSCFWAWEVQPGLLVLVVEGDLQR